MQDNTVERQCLEVDIACVGFGPASGGFLTTLSRGLAESQGELESSRRLELARCEIASGNPGRGGHRLTVAASRAIEGAREEVAALLGGDPERTLFGAGATFWLNTILSSRLERGSRVVVSSLEHNAVMRPLRWLESHHGIRVSVVQVSRTLHRITLAWVRSGGAMSWADPLSGTTMATRTRPDLARRFR